MSLCGLFASLLVALNFFNQFQTLFFLILHNHQTIESYHCTSSWPPLSFLSPSRKIVLTRNQLKHRTLEITPSYLLHTHPPDTPLILSSENPITQANWCTRRHQRDHPTKLTPTSLSFSSFKHTTLLVVIATSTLSTTFYSILSSKSSSLPTCKPKSSSTANP